MKVDFYEPPAEQKKGGLEQAILSLRDYLCQEGCAVRINPGDESSGAVPDIVHLHGLWQPPFQRISKWCRRRGVPYVVSPHGMLEPWAWRHKRWKKLPYYYLLSVRNSITRRPSWQPANRSSKILRDLCRWSASPSFPWD